MFRCPKSCDEDFKQYQSLKEYWIVDEDGKWLEDFKDPETEIDHVVCAICGTEAIEFDDEEEFQNLLEECKEGQKEKTGGDEQKWLEKCPKCGGDDFDDQGIADMSEDGITHEMRCFGCDITIQRTWGKFVGWKIVDDNNREDEDKEGS